jgi:hypothetical protein
MDNSLFGLSVLRTVPEDTIWGVLSGQYRLHGGVVRWAAGTPQAGQIVRHLIPLARVASSSLPPGLLHISHIVRSPDLALMTRQILQVVTDTMLLSGLNLAVSAISFAVMLHRLDSIETRLKAIQADVKAIRDLLERRERAELHAALQKLQSIRLVKDRSIRQAMLIQAQGTLSTMVQIYRELFICARDAEVALATEEYYCLVMLARSRCSAELSQFDLAQSELAADVKVWSEQARRAARDILIGKHPERFLYQDTVDIAPTSAIVEWLDFANNDPKGYGWIDVLRKDMRRWYRTESVGVVVHGAYSQEKERIYERETVVSGLARLTARHQVLEGQVAQLALLQELNVTPSAFEQRVEQLASLAVEGYIIV